MDDRKISEMTVEDGSIIVLSGPLDGGEYEIQIFTDEGEAEAFITLPDLRRFLTEALAALPKEGDDAA